MRNTKSKMNRLKDALSKYRVDPDQNVGNEERIHDARRISVSYEVDLRLMLSAYHIGTGGCDLSKLFIIIDFGNMLNFERSFTRYEHFLNERIIEKSTTTEKSSIEKDSKSVSSLKSLSTKAHQRIAQHYPIGKKSNSNLIHVIIEKPFVSSNLVASLGTNNY